MKAKMAIKEQKNIRDYSWCVCKQASQRDHSTLVAGDKLFWEMETRLKFIFEHNFFEQTARAVRMDDKFFRMDSPNSSNRCEFFSHE